MSNASRDHCISKNLLHAVDPKESRKGKLKIFLGIAPGVGKTFAMLKEAQILKKENVDLVVGLIDTHGRKETIVLLEGLFQIPPKRIFYKERYFDELNLEAILSRRPQLVLIDELAHSSVHTPSSTGKRWENVIEILNAGIDVYTTLNVQHIESLKDIIESIADIPVRETVPDTLLCLTTAIQFVDITPDELLTRLHDGKIYLGMQSKIASRNFFQRERLTALRDIALRYITEIVDKDLQGLSPSNKKIFQNWDIERQNHRHPPSTFSKFKLSNIKISYLITPLLTTFLVGINWLLVPYLGYQLVWFIFVLGVLAFILKFENGPALLGTAVAATIWFLFFAPFLSPITISQPEQLIFFILYTIAAVVAAILIDRTMKQEEKLICHEGSAQVIHEIVRNIINGTSTKDTLNALERSLGRLLNGDCEIILRETEGKLLVDKSKLISNDIEKTTALWVFVNDKEAGLSTSTLPMSLNLYVPIFGFQHSSGLIIYRPRENDSLRPDEKNLINSVSQLLSLYLVHNLEEQGHEHAA
ncbi:MAG: DUF4118 domain-containing protein [Parachlamydiaceae bacterium]|nr:DUF4118 domain-containing protein [Parachlamydiaceae bacterium]